MVAPLRTPLATTYDLVTGTIVDMDEAIYMTSPTDSPFLTGVGADGLSVISSKPATQKRIDWMTDSILTPRSLLGGAITTGTTAVLIQLGDGLRFGVGDLVLVENEHMRVDAFADSSTLTVVRGAPYGTAVNHASGVTVIGVGQVLPEGSAPPDARITDRVPFYNVTQIFGPEQVAMTATEQVIQKYGVPSEMSHQLMQRTIELTIRREQAYLYGRRIEDDSVARRALGGLFSFITSHSYATTSLSVPSIEIAQSDCWDSGGMPDRLAANPKSLTTLNNIADNTRVRQGFEDNRRGRYPIMEVFTEFGPLTIVRNRWLKVTDAVLFRRDQVVRRPLRPMILERLAKTRDGDSMMMVCEESLEVKGQEHMAEFTGIVPGA